MKKAYPKKLRIATCIGCGCDDFNACPHGCAWLIVDRRARRGVCSECPEQLVRWDRGERTIALPLEKRA